MGCVGAKSLIPVRNELTFLDLTVHLIQVFGNIFYDKITTCVQSLAVNPLNGNVPRCALFYYFTLSNTRLFYSV
jgi:hypothetical protein